MKAKKVILIVIGFLFLIFQLFAYLASVIMHGPVMKENDIGYFIGFNFWALLAILFFYFAYRMNKKMKRKVERGEVDNFLSNNGTLE